MNHAARRRWRSHIHVIHCASREEGKMKVGVLGSGDVAKVLASGFLKHGHDVMMGTRTSSKLTDWAKRNPKGSVGAFDEAAKFADLVVLTVKGTAALDALRAAGAANLAG